MKQVLPVILCGGSGTRLWPLSRSSFPKQFLVLSNNEDKKSLFQEAVDRLQDIGSETIFVGPTIVVTNEEHRFLALEQLRELSNVSATLLLEPAGKNTAPALTLATLCAMDMFKGPEEDPILVVTPSDQTIQDGIAFTKAIQEAVEIASKGSIVILGITPTAPETGYGYIKIDTNTTVFLEKASPVECFVEKPDAMTAEKYLANGGYFWNGGMFVLRASVWLAALKKFRPDIFDATQKAWLGKAVDVAGDTVFNRPNKDLFEFIPNESIDYAVIEKSPGVFPIQMVALNAGWSDLGSWDAVWQINKKDQDGNVIVGDILIMESTNSLVYATSRLVGAVGVDNLIIIETPDAVLVSDQSKSQDVKNIVMKLESQKREEKNLHRKVSRPWGWYDSIDEGKQFKVKRIQVKPGASLSLQLHHHRAEHWVVVRGTAEITNGENKITLLENQSTYIPKGQVHRLSNPSTEPLEIIEVQSGSYLGEDDIVRIEDVYGRD